MSLVVLELLFQLIENLFYKSLTLQIDVLLRKSVY